MAYDIVYILKEGIDSEELRYSLRSVCENFEYNKIWFYCGCPKDIKPDVFVPFKQKGNNPLDKVHNTFSAIFSNDEITEDFYLFNDDFFIMLPYDQDVPLCNGTLDKLAYIIENESGKETYYTRYLKYTSQELKKRHYDTLSYECHTPMLINREKGLKILGSLPNITLFRSAYGNCLDIKGKIIEDVKMYTLDMEPKPTDRLLSSNEESFANGKVGKYIRECFPEPCKYEITKKKRNIPKFYIEETVKKTNTEETKFEKRKKLIYNWFIRIKKDYFTFPYEE